MFFRIESIQMSPITGCQQVNPDGPRRGFRSLEAAAQFIVTAAASRNDEERPWFRLVEDRVTPDEDFDDALAVTRFAAVAAKYCAPGDWGAVVAQCVEFMHHDAD